MKEACINCVWIEHYYERWGRGSLYYCLHNSLEEPKQIDIYKTKHQQNTPRWCPGFYPKPKQPPKKMKDKFKFWSYRFREKGELVLDDEGLDEIDEEMDKYIRMLKDKREEE